LIIQVILDGQTAISMEIVRQSDIVVAKSSEQHIATRGAIENKGDEVADKSAREHVTTRGTIQRTGNDIKLNSEQQHDITRDAFQKGNDLVIDTLRRLQLERDVLSQKNKLDEELLDSLEF
jgi:hypothetical protein